MPPALPGRDQTLRIRAFKLTGLAVTALIKLGNIDPPRLQAAIMEKSEDSIFVDYPALPAKLDYRRLMQCLTTHDLDTAQDLCESNYCRPSLAQLLVGSGRMSAQDLDDLLRVKETTMMENMPVGKLLVIAGCLSTDELRYYLVLQKLLRLPIAR